MNSPCHPLLTRCSELVPVWLDRLLTQRGLAPKSCEAYGQDLHDFLAFLTELDRDGRLAAITEEEILLYLASLRAKEQVERTQARRLSALRSFFQYAVREQVVGEDPTAFCENPKLPFHLPEVLSREEMERILSLPTSTQADVRDLCMLELLYAAGLRVSELCGLTLADLDLQRGVLHVVGKGSKTRFVPVHDLAVQRLTNYLEATRPFFRPKDGHLFVNRFGHALTRQYVWKTVKRWVALAGITRDISPHTFRHSFATHLLAGGADIRTVQILLGHADISATEIYTHVETARLFALHHACHPRNLA